MNCKFSLFFRRLKSRDAELRLCNEIYFYIITSSIPETLHASSWHATPMHNIVILIVRVYYN